MCVWDKTAFSGIHRSWVKVFRSKFKASVGGGGAGGWKPTAKNFDVMKIREKIP